MTNSSEEPTEPSADDAARANAYPLGKYPAVNQNELLFSRAVAIQTYAGLEQSLSMIFSQWLGTTLDLGGLVFFRITNTHSRNRILKDLKKKQFEGQHNLFWNSLSKFIVDLDQRRNEIVHWHVMNNIDVSKPHKEASRISLTPPSGWTSGDSNKVSIDENDLGDFIKRCDFASRSVNMFYFLKTEHAATLPKALLDMFQHPISYPPPDAHPLSPKTKAD
jgi:hypothetical protein